MPLDEAKAEASRVIRNFDLNGDGEVGGADLGLLFVDWGPCR